MAKRKQRQMIFCLEGTTLCIPGYSIDIVAARDRCATLIVQKRGKKLRGVKYEQVIIDDPEE